MLALINSNTSIQNASMLPTLIAILLGKVLDERNKSNSYFTEITLKSLNGYAHVPY